MRNRKLVKESRKRRATVVNFSILAPLVGVCVCLLLIILWVGLRTDYEKTVEGVMTLLALGGAWFYVQKHFNEIESKRNQESYKIINELLLEFEKRWSNPMSITKLSSLAVASDVTVIAQSVKQPPLDLMANQIVKRFRHLAQELKKPEYITALNSYISEGRTDLVQKAVRFLIWVMKDQDCFYDPEGAITEKDVARVSDIWRESREDGMDKLMQNIVELLKK